MRLIRINYFIVFAVSILFLTQAVLNAEGNEKGKRTLQKVQQQVPVTYLDINNIFTPMRNNGISDIDVNQQNSGLVFPKGSGKTAVFTSGLLWGAKIPGDPQVRVGGTAYATGLQPGVILADGTADDPTLDKYRIYRVRPDIYPLGPTVNLSNEAILEASSESAIRGQYETDWTEWPADLGAPYFDGNNNGQYDSDPISGDIPGVPGADQTLWFVANDLNPTNTADLYGASPMGIEAQVTYWAYNKTGALGNMYFRKYILINKGAQQNTIEDMYVSMWSDVDDGASGDDFVGVDTVLSLQYCYNAGPNDAVYAPLPPPAVGFDFFQGPLVTGVAGEDRNKNGVDDAVDYGIFKGQVVGPGKINLPMTAAYYFANGDPNIGDPPQGDLDGSTQFYNFFQGKFGLSGVTFTDLSTGAPTTFALNGDPITGTGWLDGIQLSPGDRRQGSSSGPFTLAPGDTQEVVVAEIVAGAIPGVDNIAAIGLLKYFDDFAQLSYDNFFQLPPAPPAPEVNAIELPNQINLDWGENLDKVNATETFDEGGYKFQGYNVYQLPSASATRDAATRIATFDLNDNLQAVLSKTFDPNTGQILLVPEQLGTNNGISRYLEVTTDKIKGGTPLINGIKYYFAVTAYGVIDIYDKNTPIDSFPTISNVENTLSIITVIPHAPNPGEIYTPAGEFTDIVHSGLADGSVGVNIVDPTALTGDEYQVYFTQRQEIRDSIGDWIPASTVKRHFNPNDPDTLTGSSIDMAALYGPQAGTLELQFSLDLVSVDFDYADGIMLTFPAGVTVLEAPNVNVGNNNDVPLVPKIEGNVVKIGNVNHEYTGNGPFAGGEEWSVVVQADVPISVDWIIYDDGYGGGPVDAEGTTTADTKSNKSRLAKYWNLQDVTTQTVKLENQSIVGGVDLFPVRSDIPILNFTTPQTVDGFFVSVDIGYEAPINYYTCTLIDDPTGTTTLSHSSTTTDLDIQNYTIFGGTVSSKAIDNFGVGTDELVQLQQDYELRFTGVYDDGTVINGQTVYQVVEGGQIATVFRMSSHGALATNPLNPNYGTAEPFLIRIPFEVWNVDDPENPYQVNLTYRDRVRDGTEDPFYAWNPDNRMYAIIVNSPYDSTQVIQVDDGPDQFNDPATWVLVFYGTNYGLDAKVSVVYANPIVIGTDTWTFTMPGASYSNDLAKEQVNQINVFPNPYYGVNSEELNKYNRFVTFTHLPAKATVRIFNLAGVLVQTIEKNDNTQYLRWNLQNQNGLPAASGLYVAYIELPDLGTTKILKVAIIQEQQILDRF
jgi:hypothetical protein